MNFQVFEALTIKTSAGSRTIQPGGILTLSEAQAARLVETGKVIPIRQGEAEKIIKSEALVTARSLFEQTVGQLAKEIPGDALWYLKEYHSDLWQDIQAAEEAVNHFWLELQQGKDCLTSFKGAVDLYRNWFKKGYEFYQQR